MACPHVWVDNWAIFLLSFRKRCQLNEALSKRLKATCCPISTPQCEKQPSHGLSPLVGEGKLPLHHILIVVSRSGSLCILGLGKFIGTQRCQVTGRGQATCDKTQLFTPRSQGGETRLEHSLCLKCALKKNTYFLSQKDKKPYLSLSFIFIFWMNE